MSNLVNRMALQVTSCTLTKSPSQLLEKGPNYFKYRTNTNIFATPSNRRSAVELLEESKSQYVKSSSVLDTKQSLMQMATDNISSNRRLSHPVTNQPLRAKSEYDLSQLKTSEEFSSPSFLGCSNPSLMDIDCSTTESDGQLNQRLTNGVLKLDTSLRPTQQMDEMGSSIHSKSLPMTTSMIDQLEDLPLPNSATVDDIVDMLPEKITQHFQNPPLQRNSEGVVLRRQKRPIHRSQSDVTYLHTRTSDIPSMGSRLSRASVELEKFFNEMGIDRTILDPMLRQQEESVQKDADFFETLSSLDSPDTRSICSGISRSEKGQSDVETLDRQQNSPQNTSIVERNARIIKWLCNVKKARSQSAN